MNTMTRALTATLFLLFAAPASAALEEVQETMLVVADVFETAGYDDSAAVIRDRCKPGTNPFECALSTATEVAVFTTWRHHPTIATGFEMLGEDALANEYRRCHTQDSTTGAANRYGSYHCTEDVALFPVQIATERSVVQLGGALDTLGYHRSADRIRQECARGKPLLLCYTAITLELTFLPIMRHQPALVTVYRTLGYPDLAREYERCDESGTNADCFYMQPDLIQEIIDRELDGILLDVTGDQQLTAADFATVAGSGARFTVPADAPLAQQRLVGWMNALAAGPSMDATQAAELTPVFDMALITAATLHRASRSVQVEEDADSLGLLR